MKKTRTLPFVFLIIAAACSTIVDVDFDLKKFEQERKAWEQANITEYEYTYASFGFIGGKYKVRVSGDKCEITDEDTGETVVDNDYKIENLYKGIKDVYDKHQNSEVNLCKSDYFYYSKINVEYDEENHIPLKIEYIYEAPENLAVDGDFYHEITGFKILKD